MEASKLTLIESSGSLVPAKRDALGVITELNVLSIASWISFGIIDKIFPTNYIFIVHSFFTLSQLFLHSF
jgi:hypothetical protein